ncbi:MAG: alpha/beta hydrolase [Thermoleophilaceae bacterium]
MAQCCERRRGRAELGRRVGVVAAAALALALAAPAQAQRLVTLTTTSKYVDPAKQQFNKPPPGEPERPNALRVNVLLPDGYDEGGRFPVLYLLHGHGDTYDAWANRERGDVEDIARGFPGLIVMPEGAQGWYADWWNAGKRANPAWERYYLDELIPLIERTFRIRKGRQWHAIAGLSMGAEGSVYFAEQRPGYFGSVASFSGPLSIQRPEYADGGMDTQGQKFTDVFGPTDGFYATAHNPMANVVNLKSTRAYVTVGNGVGSFSDATNYFGAIAEADLHQHADDFVAAAKDAGVDVTYAPRNGVHDWPYWREHLAAAIKWGFFKPVAKAPARWQLRTASQTGDAWGFSFAFAKPPTEIETFKRNGDRIAASGAGSVTIRAPNGRRFSAKLPFDRRIPAKARKRAHRRR